MNVNPGYWRKTANSTNIIECINKDACQGGYTSIELDPIECTIGYKGNLCTKCNIIGSTKYQEVGGFQCQK